MSRRFQLREDSRAPGRVFYTVLADDGRGIGSAEVIRDSGGCWEATVELAGAAARLVRAGTEREVLTALTSAALCGALGIAR